jgi:hypothetical protein
LLLAGAADQARGTGVRTEIADKAAASPVGAAELRKRKKPARWLALILESNGRDGVIRTLDPLHPMQVRYQAALRPDESEIIADGLPYLHAKSAPFIEASRAA